MAKTFYDNSHLCEECTGSGCKHCGYTGQVRWPLALAVNNAKPPAIAKEVNKPVEKITVVVFKFSSSLGSTRLN
jgi:hypothetical protein